MFGWNGFKYRTQVIVDIHSILMFVPELKKLLKTFPTLRRSAGEFRKLEKSELEAAAYLSVVVLEIGVGARAAARWSQQITRRVDKI